MKNLLEITAYEAILAMHKGIKAALKCPTFELEMNVYGSYYDDICFGCAATAAIQELNGRFFTGIEITYMFRRAYACAQNEVLFDAFETALESFRLGWESQLLVFKKFYGLETTPLPVPNWVLHTGVSISELNKIRTWANTNKKYLKVFPAHNYKYIEA